MATRIPATALTTPVGDATPVGTPPDPMTHDEARTSIGRSPRAGWNGRRDCEITAFTQTSQPARSSVIRVPLARCMMRSRGRLDGGEECVLSNSRLS